MTALRKMRGSDYQLRLNGIDELNILHDSPLLEACNTSFQVHLQVAPQNFVVPGSDTKMTIFETGDNLGEIDGYFDEWDFVQDVNKQTQPHRCRQNQNL